MLLKQHLNWIWLNLVHCFIMANKCQPLLSLKTKKLVPIQKCTNKLNSIIKWQWESGHGYMVFIYYLAKMLICSEIFFFSSVNGRANQPTQIIRI